MTRYVVLIATTLLVGCAGSTGNAPSTGALPGTLQQRASTRLTHPPASHAWLWAGGQLDNAVNAYDLDQPGYPQVATITQGVNAPGGIKVDSQGTLYVANWANASGNGNVTIYPFGQTFPSATLTGLSVPADVAVDTNGDVYVSDRGTTPPSIVKYLAGQTTPSKYIASNLIQFPTQMAFDSARTLYLCDDKAGVSIMKHGTFTLTSLRLKHLGVEPGGLVLDPSNGHLLEGDARAPDSLPHLKIYASGERRPEYAIPSTTYPIHFMAIGTVGSHLDLFVPNYGTQTPIYILHHDARQPFALISNNLHGINGVALKPANVP
jgi:NHL repeat-containing protein